MKPHRSRFPASPRSSARPGTMLVFAMIALLVTTMIGASLLQTAVSSMRQIQREQQQIQASWLAEAGCQRAIAKRRADPEYTGETWDVPAAELQSPSGAVVRITVEASPGEEAPQQIMTSIAEYPKASALTVRVTRRITIPVAAATKQ